MCVYVCGVCVCERDQDGERIDLTHLMSALVRSFLYIALSDAHWTTFRATFETNY